MIWETCRARLRSGTGCEEGHYRQSEEEGTTYSRLRIKHGCEELLLLLMRPFLSRDSSSGRKVLHGFEEEASGVLGREGEDDVAFCAA